MAYIREGSSSFSRIKYYIDGHYIREGSQSFGAVVYYCD